LQALRLQIVLLTAARCQHSCYSSAVRGRLHEFDGDLSAATTGYAEAARRATSATTWSDGPPALEPAELYAGCPSGTRASGT
jgi:hypothetical protein